MRTEGQKEVSNLKVKYEQIIDELKRNAASDKEFVVGELKKEIKNLEQKIEDMKAQWAIEREALQGDAGSATEKLKAMIE